MSDDNYANYSTEEFGVPQEDDKTTVMPRVTQEPLGWVSQSLPGSSSLRSLLEVRPTVSASQVILKLKELEEVEEDPKSPWPKILVSVGLAAVLGIGVAVYVHGASGEEKVVAEPVETEGAEEPSEPSEPEVEVQGEDKEVAEKEPKEEGEPEVEVEEEDQSNPLSAKSAEPDVVSKIIETTDGTEIHEFEAKNMVPYEKFFEGSEGVNESETVTGNGVNDENQQYRMDLGMRGIGSLSPEDYPEGDVRKAIEEGVQKTGLELKVPDKPDYSKARAYSSGYTMWPISDGYVMVIGDGKAVAVIGPEEKDEALSQAAVDSGETLIPQRYADRYGVSFGVVSKTVSGSKNPSDSESLWQ